VSLAIRQIELKDFARNVERLCDFLLGDTSEGNSDTGSKDRQVLTDLKTDAADIQFDRLQVISEQEPENETVESDESEKAEKLEGFAGLSDYMRGLHVLEAR